MPGVKKIEVCISNIELGSQYVWDQVAIHYPEIRLKRWGCLGFCHRCVHQPFVLIDDEVFLEAETPETLWSLVRELIEKKAEADNDERAVL